jgi:hypothetical protein
MSKLLEREALLEDGMPVLKQGYEILREIYRLAEGWE